MMAANMRERAVHRLQWVLGTHRLPTDVARALVDAVEALEAGELRQRLSDDAIRSQLDELLKLREGH